MLETSHLRCFVTVAEELHFGRAAARLNMTQPPLSRQIMLLERAMGCLLLRRNSRMVELTEAGTRFLPEAQKIIRLIEHSRAMTLEVAEGSRGSARCGFTASTAYDFLPRFLHHFRRRQRDIDLSLHEMVSREQVRALQLGTIDVGFARALTDLSEFRHRLLLQEHLLLALPADHALTRRPDIAWSDLNGCDMVMYEGRSGEYFHNLVSSRLMHDRIRPRIVQELSQIHSMLALVRAGVGLAVVPASATRLRMSNVVFREFSDPSPLKAELMIVWHRDATNPVVPRIAAEAEACAAIWRHDLEDGSVAAKEASS